MGVLNSPLSMLWHSISLFPQQKLQEKTKGKILKISLLKTLDEKMLELTNAGGEYGQVPGKEAAQRPLHMMHQLLLIKAQTFWLTQEESSFCIKD